MKEEIDYTKLLPQTIPEGMLEHFIKNGYLKANGLIYQTEYVKNPLTEEKEKVVRLKCSACGGEMYAKYRSVTSCSHGYSPAPYGFYHPNTDEPIISHNDTLCPMCGAEVRAYHTGSLYQNKRHLENIYPLNIVRINDDIAILKWYIAKYVTKQGGIIYESSPSEGYIFSGRKCTKVTGYRWGFFGVKHSTGKWGQLKRCTDQMGEIERKLIYNFDMKLLEGTSLENSKLDKYLKSSKISYPITYLRVYQKHKNVENLVMQGAGRLVSNAIYKRRNLYYRNEYASDINGIDWKEKSPFKMLGLNKTEFKIAVKDKWLFEDIEFYKEAKDKGITPELIKECKKESYYQINKIFKCEYEDNIPRVIRYLKKQRIVCDKNDIDVQYLIDYWNMKNALNESVKDLKVRYPQKIVDAHDEVMRRQKYEKDMKLAKCFKERFKTLSKFSFDDGNLMIVPAKDDHELYIEGKLLNHCVHRYSESHATGKTAIFFIRHSSEPEKPYFTLELDEKEIKVRQNRGHCNCDRTQEVIEFEKVWLEHIRKVREKEHIRKVKEKKNAKRNNETRKSA